MWGRFAAGQYGEVLSNATLHILEKETPMRGAKVLEYLKHLCRELDEGPVARHSALRWLLPIAALPWSSRACGLRSNQFYLGARAPYDRENDG